MPKRQTEKLKSKQLGKVRGNSVKQKPNQFQTPQGTGKIEGNNLLRNTSILLYFSNFQ